MSLSVPASASPTSPRQRSSVPRRIALLFALWLAIFAASLWTPPLLNDADATHAQAAQAMLHTGDLITLHVDGVRYLEKAPLPYWIAALSLKLFGETAFAIHLPLALTVLVLALLGYLWSRRVFNELAAFYTALFTLTTTGVFLFTRIFIPDALLALFLNLALYNFLRAHNPGNQPGAATSRTNLHAYLMWTTLALAVLTKGLAALVVFFATIILYLLVTKSAHNVRRLKPFTGLLLFIAIAAPWHILAGLRNTHGADGHGFFWFYFINEHVLRFLGRRIPRDYNKLPTLWYWTLHLVWLFPWSLFAPAAILTLFRKRNEQQRLHDTRATGEPLTRLERLARPPAHRRAPLLYNSADATTLLLLIFSAIVAVFFSLSTNQEYYTFPIYLPLLLLIAAALATSQKSEHRALTLAFVAFTVVGLTIAAALAYGLWTSRHLPFAPDIGAVLAHRGIGQYTLSMSHFFDLTAPSFAALRLPAILAAIAFTLGPVTALLLWKRRGLHAAILAIAFTSAAFLIAAHLALVRFTPMLSSQDFANTLSTLEQKHRIAPNSTLLLYGDQAYGSSIPFYLNRQVLLVDGRTTSMLFGSTFPDAPPIFLSPTQLAATWGHGPRKILFVPAERRDDALQLLPTATLLGETSGKLLLTDRALDTPAH